MASFGQSILDFGNPLLSHVLHMDNSNNNNNNVLLT